MIRFSWCFLSGLLFLAAFQTPSFAQARLASAFGEANVGSQRVIVHATVTVPPGLDGNTVARAALRDRGARPFESAEFALTGLVWDQFFNAQNDVVTLYYNPSGQPVSTLPSLHAAQQTWNVVPTSLFTFVDGGSTSRCPSLVKECPGAQKFDGWNDVGWVSMGGCCTLAVTWYSTSIDEIDMALNSRFNWSIGGNGYDVETVILHEAGHGLGLGHSPVAGAVMEPNYGGPRRALHIDDQRGVTYLYPEDGATASISGNVAGTGGPISGATVSVDNLPAAAVTDALGNYSITGVPKIATYVLTASAPGYGTAVYPGVEAGDGGINFSLGSGSGGGGGDGGGGGCIPRGKSGKCK